MEISINLKQSDTKPDACQGEILINETTILLTNVPCEGTTEKAMLRAAQNVLVQVSQVLREFTD